MTHQPTQDTFSKAYAQLNQAQRAAVDTIEGPVLVIAGPGTGKTQILASRIAKILSDTDALAANVLCLTYTDAGAVAMRNRLVQFIGTEAYRIHIHTFHSFCNAVIQQHQEYFSTRTLDLIDDLGKKQLVHELLDALPADHVLKKYTGDVYSDTNRILELFSVMKKENWSAEYISGQAQAYLKDLPNREEYIYKKKTKTNQAGDVKQHMIDRETEYMLKLSGAAWLFESYQSRLSERGLYDFDDMIIWVLNAFQKHKALLLTYQEQYQYMLVDEFQDSSRTQIQLIDMLAGYWDTPNLFCVGDDDQSIFKFQGANIENISHFMTRYNPALIRLEENYRSSQHILDTAVSLIKQNEHSRLLANKQLIAKNEQVATLPQKPIVRRYLNPMHESSHVCAEIASLIKQGIAPSEIAVLYRNHAQADLMVAWFRQHNIPVQMRKSVNCLQEPFIKQLLTLLRYLSSEMKKPDSGSHLLFEVLHFHCFQINSLDLVRISLDIYHQQRTDKAYSWREALAKFATSRKPDLFNPANGNTPVQKAVQIIESWVKASHNLTTLQLIEKVINESGLLLQALTSVEKSWYMQLLHTFFDFAKRECARNPRARISDVLDVVELMEKEGVALPAQKIFHTNNGVQCMTVHGSKGLEFEYVYMIGCTEQAWKQKNTNRQFKMPDNLYEIKTEEDDTEESRRLFYVGITRAKKQLTLSWFEHDSQSKVLEKSMFLAELESADTILNNHITLTDSEVADFAAAIHTLQQPTADKKLFDNEWVDDVLKQYSMSVTHLNNYLRCPTAFYFNNLIRIPSPLSPAMSFGSAVHFSIEHFFRKMQQDPSKQFPDVEYLLHMFRFSMNLYSEAFTEKEYTRRLAYGEQILAAYYNQYITTWNKIVLVEKPYYNEVFEQVPINGKLDKLEFDGNQVTVVDYKTGKYENAKKKLKRPDQEQVMKSIAAGKEPEYEDQMGGDYWRQAVFYKILIDASNQNTWQMHTAIFDFIEPDTKSKKHMQSKLIITDEDVQMVGKQIKGAYEGIMKKQFENGCNKSDCVWCTFKSTYYSSHSFSKSAIVTDKSDDESDE